MLAQHAMIDRLREICHDDRRVVAALLYGSFATGEGDAYSDIEAVVFFDPAALPTLDRAGWVAAVAPLLAFFPDEFGHYTAIFDNLVRGEFHFEPSSRIPVVSTWVGYGWYPTVEAALLVDRTGALTRAMRSLVGAPPARDAAALAPRLVENLANLILFGAQVLRRGEVARASELLVFAARHLQHLARLVEGATAHWPTPSRALEHDLSPEAYRRYLTCTARADAPALRRAYRAAWEWGVELAEILAARHALALPTALMTRITAYLAEV